MVRALNDPFVSGAAVEALAKVENLPRLRRELGRIHRKSTKTLLQDIISSLENKLEAAQRALLQLLETAEALGLREAAKGLVYRNHTELARALLSLCKDTGSKVKMVRAFGTVYNEKAMDALLLTIYDPQEKVRHAAAGALRAIGYRNADVSARVATALLDSKDKELWKAGLDILFECECRSALNRVAAMLKDENEAVVVRAARVLAKWGSPDCLQMLEHAKTKVAPDLHGFLDDAILAIRNRVGQGG